MPRIPIFHSEWKEVLFSGVWLLFAFLVVGEQLDQLIGMDEEKRNRFKRLTKYQLRKKEQDIIKIQKERKKAFM